MNQPKRDFISFLDFTRDEIWELLMEAERLKKNPLTRTLRGKSIGLIFQKPSTRTSVSFAVGVHQLGGQPLILNAEVLQIKRGESPRDTGRVLSRYLDAIVMRANRHEYLAEMAGYARIPVVNGLTEREHPCQILADLLTIIEQKNMKHPRELAGFQLTYLGDANNVSNSLMFAGALLGMKIHAAGPEPYRPKKNIVDRALRAGLTAKSDIQIFDDAKEAARGADALYTDVWASMGQEAESLSRRSIFAPYQLNAGVLRAAKPKALVMHCLPAHRGEEITEEALEGSQSVVFEQAENRLHVQKAVLKKLLAGKEK